MFLTITFGDPVIYHSLDTDSHTTVLELSTEMVFVQWMTFGTWNITNSSHGKRPK